MWRWYLEVTVLVVVFFGIGAGLMAALLHALLPASADAGETSTPGSAP